MINLPWPYIEAHDDGWCSYADSYSRDQMIDIYNEALELAAKIADGVNNHDNPMTSSDVADSIRNLKHIERTGPLL